MTSCGYPIYNLYGMSDTCAYVMSFPIDKSIKNTYQLSGGLPEGWFYFLLVTNWMILNRQSSI